MKSDFLIFCGQKADFSGKKRTNLGAYFHSGLISDQSLIKRSYLAALLVVELEWGGSDDNLAALHCIYYWWS